MNELPFRRTALPFSEGFGAAFVLRANFVMTPDELQERTFRFAVGVVRMSRVFPRLMDGDVVARQLVRSATSVGANYRAARRGRSAKEFAAKVGIVNEEADESLYWLELAVAAGLVDESRAEPLVQEATELRAIFARSAATARRKTGETD